MAAQNAQFPRCAHLSSLNVRKARLAPLESRRLELERFALPSGIAGFLGIEIK
jgi:hypothetical protein